LSTSEDYLIEVAGHIQEALKLERFLALPILERLKSSNNVFFNYYKHLVKTHKLLEDLSLTDWFHEMLDMEDFPDYNNAGFTYTIARRLRRMYEMLNITVIYHGPYENFQAVKKAYEIELSYKNWPRPSMSIDNDVRSILYLASREHHVNAALGLRIEPFLVTWDNMFFAVRKAVLSNINRYLNLCNWFIYAPAKLADRLSVMNLKLNPKAIDYNIISVAETSFNLYNKGETFLDVLSTFFNRKNVSEMRLATKLLAMEEQTITEEPEKEQEFEKASPLTNILLAVRRHYVRTLEEFKFPDLIQVFENDAYEEPVIKIFENSLEEYNKNAGKLSDAIFIKFNELIKKFREGLTQQEPPQ